MFDIMNYADKNHVEIDVRPGAKPIAWEFFVRDRQLDIVKFTRIHERELADRFNADEYLEKRIDDLMQDILDARKKQRTA